MEEIMMYWTLVTKFHKTVLKVLSTEPIIYTGLQRNIFCIRRERGTEPGMPRLGSSLESHRDVLEVLISTELHGFISTRKAKPVHASLCFGSKSETIYNARMQVRGTSFH